jgi:hypothetical protein
MNFSLVTYINAHPIDTLNTRQRMKNNPHNSKHSKKNKKPLRVLISGVVEEKAITKAF